MIITVVVPVYNESEGILNFIGILQKELELIQNCERSVREIQLVFVNDGSSDDTLEKIQLTKIRYPYKVIDLSRNFGHQAALWAGLEHVDKKSHAIVLDADLQDPPRLIGSIVSSLTENEVVLMQRVARTDAWFKKITAGAYYWLLQKLAGPYMLRNVGDFFGLSPKALKALLSHTESVKYIRGLITDIGFEPKVLQYERDGRQQGKTHYSMKKMISLALSGVTGFSVSPLVLVVWLAVCGGLLSILLVAYVAYLRLLSDVQLQPGWAFLSISFSVISTFQLISLAGIALYISRIVSEVKKRPIYHVKQILKGG